MSISRYLLLTALAVSLCSAVAHAQNEGDYYRDADIELVSHATVAKLSRQIAEMEARLASFDNTKLDGCGVAHGGGCDAGCDAGCGGGCGGGCGNCCWDWWTNPNCGLTGQAEVVWLRPQATDPGTNLGTQYHHGSRWTVGYVENCGCGISNSAHKMAELILSISGRSTWNTPDDSS